MLRAILYLSLTFGGMIGTFVNPFIGAITCLEAYLLNPSVIPMPGNEFRFQFWTTVAFLLSCLIRQPKPAPKVGRESFILWAIWAWVALAAASALWAVINPQLALDTIYEVFKTLVLSTFLVLAISTEKQIRIAMNACLIGAFHAALLHTLGIRYGYIPPSFGREVGLLPDLQTAVLVFFVPMFVIVAVTGSKWEKIFCWLALPIVLNSIVTSYMRAALVSMGVELALIFLLLNRKTTKKLIPAVAAGLILFFVRLTPDSYWEWMSTIKNPTEETSANSRFLIAETSWRIFSDHPMGVGYRNYIEISPQYYPPELLDYSTGKRAAHNSLMTVLCETGIIGFILFMTSFGGCALLLRRIRKTCEPANPSRVALYAMALEIGLYGWTALGMFHTEHDLDPAYWTLAFTVVLTRLHWQARQRTQVSSTDVAKVEVEDSLPEPEFAPGDWAHSPHAGNF